MSSVTRLHASDASVKPLHRGQTRARLLEAARELFVERGFHATRPQDISRAAGVGHGTFYLHFKDKQACFLVFADSAAAELEAFIRARVPEELPPYVAIRETIRFSYEFARTHPGLIAAALADMSVIDGGTGGSPLMARFGALWAQWLARWRAEGLVGAHVDPEIVGHAMPGILRQVGAHAAETDTDLDVAVSRLMAFIAAGLGIDGPNEKAGGKPA